MFITAFYRDTKYEKDVKEISDSVVVKCRTFDEKVLALRRFVRDKMRFSEGRLRPDGRHIRSWDIYKLDTIERLNSGLGGWCSQQAAVFMHLAEKQGIDTRLVSLYTAKDRKSQHAITLALSPDNRWVIIDLDPEYDLELFTKDGKIASREDIRKDKSILYENPAIKNLIKENPALWTDDRLSMYYNELARVRNTRHGQKL